MDKADKTLLVFYFPNARMLSSSEVAALPEEKKRAADRSGRNGVWLEVHCPGGACVGTDGKVTLEAVGSEGRQDKGLWLKVFCPEDSCLWKGGTELP